MEYIDKYFASIFYVANAYQNPKISDELRSSIQTDLKKTMIIGATLSICIRFCIWKRYYLLKNYIHSSLYGSIFGLAYSPYFLSKKVDE
jgi:hypothetical protein